MESADENIIAKSFIRHRAAGMAMAICVCTSCMCARTRENIALECARAHASRACVEVDRERAIDMPRTRSARGCYVCALARRGAFRGVIGFQQGSARDARLLFVWPRSLSLSLRASHTVRKQSAGDGWALSRRRRGWKRPWRHNDRYIFLY